MNGFAGRKLKLTAAHPHHLRALTGEVHLYATAHWVVPNKVAKRASVEVASKFAIDAIQEVEIELRGDTGDIVVGGD